MLVYPVKYAVWNIKGTLTALVVNGAVEVPDKVGRKMIKNKYAIKAIYPKVERKINLLELFSVEYGIDLNKLLDYEAKNGL